jgi:hypothetical protein
LLSGQNNGWFLKDNVSLKDGVSLALKKIFAGEAVCQTLVLSDGKILHIYLKDWRVLPIGLKKSERFELRIVRGIISILIGDRKSDEIIGPGNKYFCVQARNW